MKILEILCESPQARIEYLAKTLGPKLTAAAEKDHLMKSGDPVDIAAALAEVDPTPNKKALPFLGKLYVAKAFKMEDKARIKDAIALFFRVANRLENKDLMSYKDLGALYDAIEPFEKAEDDISARQQKKLTKSEAEKIIDTPDFKVIVPKTEEAAKFYGANTKWCTVAKDGHKCFFNHYNKQGPLYIIIARDGGKDRKFQLHYESDQFKDERDFDLKSTDIAFLSKFPQYKEFLEHLIDKHYGHFIEEK